MRWAEILIWLMPPAAIAIWWFGPRHFSRRAVVLAWVVLAVFAVLLAQMGRDRAIQGPYVPAHLDHGTVAP